MDTIREGHIGYRETIALLTIVLTSKVFMTFPRSIIIDGQTAGWIVALVDLLVTLAAVLPAACWSRSAPCSTGLR